MAFFLLVGVPFGIWLFGWLNELTTVWVPLVAWVGARSGVEGIPFVARLRALSSFVEAGMPAAPAGPLAKPQDDPLLAGALDPLADDPHFDRAADVVG